MPLFRALDPASRLAEALFGLIMTLSFTLTASVILQEEGRAGARALLLAIFGCNFAWGVIDAALYLLGQLVERGRKRQVWLALERASDEVEAERILGDELDELVGRALEPAERAVLYRSLHAKLRTLEPASVRLTREDWRAAMASFWIVFATSIPAALPFFLTSDSMVALRTSNGLLLLLLVAIGHRTAQHMGLRHPLRFGLALLAIGMALVAVAIALGG